MVTSLIRINGGVGGESNPELTLSSPVTLANDDDTGVTSWLWEMVSKPRTSAASLTSTTSSTSGFTPDVRGSYLIQLTVNGRVKSRIIAAVRNVTGMRIPARYEADEYQGWEQAVFDNFNVVENSLGGAGIHDLAGAFHNPTSLALLNSKITDADLDATTASRPPNGAAGGQLGGTYPNPSVVGITEGFGVGQAMSVGVVSNYQLLSRSGSNIIGVYTSSPLPRLEWSSATEVIVSPKNGEPTTAYLTLQDNVQRRMVGNKTFNITTSLQGGLDTGSEAPSTWYYLYLVPNTGDNTLLAVIGSVNGPSTGPTGYTNFKYVGAVYNDSSGDIRPFTQINESEFIWHYQFETVASAALTKTQLYDGGSATLVSLDDVVPPATASAANIAAKLVKDTTTAVTLSMEIFEETNLDQVTTSPTESSTAMGRITANENAEDIAEGSFRVPITDATPTHGMRIFRSGGATVPTDFAIYGRGFVDGWL